MLKARVSQHLANMVQHWLGPLVRRASAKDLIDTLYHYLATGSISATAEQLFLHPNSVRYRLAKICDALEISNLEDISIRENLWLASKFWRFRQ
jgi:DNA-binding PucR family transcriptional regulator